MTKTFEPGQWVYVTKYALTSGIRCLQVAASRDDGPYVTAWLTSAPNGWATYHINDVFATQEEAEDRFHDLRKRKIASLEKQIVKYEALQPKYDKLAKSEPREWFGRK